MARWLSVVGILVALFTLSSVTAQDTKKGKIAADAIFKKLDANGDDKLSKDEFLKFCDRFKDKEKARAKLATAFGKLDTASRGYLSKEQFRTYLDAAKKKDARP